MLWDDTPLHPKEKPQPTSSSFFQHLHHCFLLSLLLTSASFENKCFEASVFGFPGSEPVPSACWVGLRCKVIQWPGGSVSHTVSRPIYTLQCTYTHAHILTYTHTYTHTCFLYIVERGGCLNNVLGRDGFPNLYTLDQWSNCETSN